MNIQDVRCFLLDMDGTFYLGENLIPGSLDFIRRVEETGGGTSSSSPTIPPTTPISTYSASSAWA